MQEMWLWSLDQEDPQRRKWQPTPVFLLGKSHELCSPQGHKESGATGHGTQQQTRWDSAYWHYLASLTASCHRNLHWIMIERTDSRYRFPGFKSAFAVWPSANYLTPRLQWKRQLTYDTKYELSLFYVSVIVLRADSDCNRNKSVNE